MMPPIMEAAPEQAPGVYGVNQVVTMRSRNGPAPNL
jgi:hypothetical protein